MKTFKVEIKEILSRVIEIKANSKDEAIQKTEDLYRDEEIVLDYNDFQNLNINSFDEIEDLKKKLNDVIEYLYSDEKRNFEEYEVKPTDHIFLKLEVIKNNIDKLIV